MHHSRAMTIGRSYKRVSDPLSLEFFPKGQSRGTYIGLIVQELCDPPGVGCTVR